MATVVHGLDHYLTNQNTSQPAPMHRNNARIAKNTLTKMRWACWMHCPNMGVHGQHPGGFPRDSPRVLVVFSVTAAWKQLSQGIDGLPLCWVWLWCHKAGGYDGIIGYLQGCSQLLRSKVHYKCHHYCTCSNIVWSFVVDCMLDPDTACTVTENTSTENVWTFSQWYKKEARKRSSSSLEVSWRSKLSCTIIILCDERKY